MSLPPSQSSEAKRSSPPIILPSEQLTSKLAQLRSLILAVETGKGIALTAIVCIELLAVQMMADWWLDFSRATRGLLFLVQFAIFNAILFRYVFLPRFRPPEDEDLALRVECAHPELASRLISAIQLAKPGALSPGAAPSFALSTIEQTEALTASMDFGQWVDLRPLKKLACAGAAVLLLAAGGFYASRAVSIALLQRAFLANVEVPRKTRITFITGELTVGRGDAVLLEAAIEGIHPSRGTLIVSGQGKKDSELEILALSTDRSKFARTLENIQEDFSYQIRLNDAVSPIYPVHVVPRPAANPPECEVVPPIYTGLKPAKRSPGDLSLLAGSRLKIRALATKDLKSATLVLVGIEERRTLAVDPARPREILAELSIPAKGLTGFSLELEDQNGMKSAAGTVYRVDILPDKPPQARITWPERKEELLTRLATLVIGFDVRDDFAIGKVALKYRVSSVEAGAEKSLEMNLGDSSNRFRRRHEWALSSFQPALSEGTVIEYWIEAEDNNNVTGPGIGRSDHQIARIVSESDKRSDLLNRAGDSMGVLGDITADQEKLNRSLGTLILEKTGPQP